MKLSFFKNFLKIICFLALLGVLIIGVNQVLSWKDTTGDEYSVLQSLYATPDNTIDAVFMGSSHCYCTVNNSILWDEYGYSTFDMSVSGQDMESTYYNLVELLKTQNPKVVFTEMVYTAWYGYENIGNLYRNVLNYKYSENLYNAASGLSEYDDDVSVLELFLKFPVYHTRYTELVKSDFVSKYTFRRGYGGSYSQGISYLPTYDEDMERQPLREDTVYWMDKIRELTAEHDIELVYFIAPFGASYEGHYFVSVEDYAKEYDIPVVNFLTMYDELELDTATDFLDFSHLNNLGAQKVTEYLGQYIEENFSLQDHRNDEGYDFWEEDSLYFAHKEIENQLINTQNLELYLDQIKDLEDFTVLISMDPNLVLDEKMMDLFEDLGLDDTVFQTGMTAVISSGEVIFEQSDKDSYTYTDPESGTTLYIKNTPVTEDDSDIAGTEEAVSEDQEEDTEEDTEENTDGTDSNDENKVSEKTIMIDGEAMTISGSGIYIIIYDPEFNEVTDQVSFDQTSSYYGNR